MSHRYSVTWPRSFHSKCDSTKKLVWAERGWKCPEGKWLTDLNLNNYSIFHTKLACLVFTICLANQTFATSFVILHCTVLMLQAFHFSEFLRWKYTNFVSEARWERLLLVCDYLWCRFIGWFPVRNTQEI